MYKTRNTYKKSFAAVNVPNTFAFCTSIDRIYRNIALCLVQNTMEVVQKVIKRVIGKEEGATNDIDGEKKKLLTLTSYQEKTGSSMLHPFSQPSPTS